MEYNFTYREKDKGFQVILSYKDNVGRWKQKSKQGFKTKREAKNAGDKLLEEVKASNRSRFRYGKAVLQQQMRCMLS